MLHLPLKGSIEYAKEGDCFQHNFCFNVCIGIINGQIDLSVYTAHCYQQVKNWFCDNYPECWVRRSGPISLTCQISKIRITGHLVGNYKRPGLPKFSWNKRSNCFNPISLQLITPGQIALWRNSSVVIKNIF